MKREFSSLSPQEALHVAIFVEERNAEIYEQFADLFSEFKDEESIEIAGVFWEMAEEERAHGTELQDRYMERYGTQQCAVTEEEIRDIIELPKIENCNIFAFTRAKILVVPAAQALQVALSAERAAQRYYARLIEITRDPGLRSLYKELSQFERDHTRLLERRLEQVKAAGGGMEA